MLAQVPDYSATVRSMYDLALLAAIVGAVIDRRYKKAGGRRPSVRHRIALGIGAVLCAALLTVEGVLRNDPEWLGRRTWDLLVLTFMVWELTRWFVRGAHPLRRAAD